MGIAIPVGFCAPSFWILHDEESGIFSEQTSDIACSSIFCNIILATAAFRSIKCLSAPATASFYVVSAASSAWQTGHLLKYFCAGTSPGDEEFASCVRGSIHEASTSVNSFAQRPLCGPLVGGCALHFRTCCSLAA